MTQRDERTTARLRVGPAAEMLGVSVEIFRRWEADGRLRLERSRGGQRLVPASARRRPVQPPPRRR